MFTNLINPIEQTVLLFSYYWFHFLRTITSRQDTLLLLIIILIIYLFIYFSDARDYGHIGYISKLRELPVWKIVHWYNDIKVHFFSENTRKECKNMGTIHAKRNYILTPNHHGYISTAIMHGILTQTEYFNKSRLYVGVHKYIMKMPFIWDWFKIFGCFNIERRNVIRHLKNRDNILIVPGGAKEMLKCDFETYDMSFYKRDGILRIAYKMKTAILPIYIYGANRIFQTRPIPYITDFFFKRFDYPFPLFIWGPTPTKVRVYVSDPVLPEKYETYDAFRYEYYRRLFGMISDKETANLSREVRNQMKKFGI
jgi:1-acyl-sn-glycerol-3-phosphate acyltransferase